MLRTFLALSAIEKMTFIEAWWLFLKSDYRIRHADYATWQNRIFGVELPANNTLSLPSNLVPLIEKAARNHLRKMNCLRRCMVTMEMLQRRGIKADLHFGVRINAGKTEAHCWLSWQGQLINDGPEVVSTYTELEPRPWNELQLLKSAGLKHRIS